MFVVNRESQTFVLYIKNRGKFAPVLHESDLVWVFGMDLNNLHTLHDERMMMQTAL